MVGKPDALAMWDGLLDTGEQDILREDCIMQAGRCGHLSTSNNQRFSSTAKCYCRAAYQIDIL